MNAHEMVIGIVLIVTIGSIIRAKLGVGRRFRGERFAGLHGSQDNGEADRLRDGSASSRSVSRFWNASRPTAAPRSTVNSTN
jgi:hypothetical protein